MINRTLLLLTIISFFTGLTHAQTYSVDARVTPKEIISGQLKMGNPGPAGKEILINNKYMTVGGKPVIPVMGEMHFSRYPRDQWEDAVLKMKANGINIIATYVFWIHHEEVEGQFDWSGNKDFRSFIKLCAKHGMWVYPRIGPWCHGEVRNGGTPDWLLEKKNVDDRSNQPGYQFYADRLYREIAKQMEGLYYKDGGPIIGIQLENEYRRGKGGEAHILWLKQTALKYGMDVPMYTVTGWGNASVPQDEVIPLFGGYPAEPWATHIGKINENPAFTFEGAINDEHIGSDIAAKENKNATDYSHYPYFTCEIGVGNQVSYHRRPILSPFDGLAIVTGKIGSGSNLPGYYVFTGGSNPVGIYTTLEENQDETGYWNQYPDISYDFQAAIKETGELAPSYYQVKKLHYFLNEFGSRLAPMLPVIPSSQDATKDLAWAVRVKENAGFVFGMNYYRGMQKPEQKNVQFSIALPNETLVFPSKPVSVTDSTIFIWPFNFDMDGTLLHYATAQPLCKIDQKDRTDWFFIQTRGVTPEFAIDASNIESIEADNGKITRQDKQYLITAIKPGFSKATKIKNKNGQLLHIIVLSYEESDKVWLFENDGTKQLFVSDANMYINGNTLHLYGYKPDATFTVLSQTDGLVFNDTRLTRKPVGNYMQFHVTVPEKHPEAKLTKKNLFDDSQWLRTGVDKVSPKNQLYHKIFIKEFSAENPSPVKSATLYIFTDNPGKLEFNRNWLNQEIVPGKINRIDVTGYVQRGENIITADFPFTEGNGAFVARLDIEYFNSDRIQIVTDPGWLTTESYTLPAPWSSPRGLKSPETVVARTLDYTNSPEAKQEWSLSLPNGYLSGLNNAYLHINFNGDMGRCYLRYRLVADIYNNGTPWQIQLKKFGDQLESEPLIFEIIPLKPGYKIYFEKEPIDVGKAEISNIQVIPEYGIDLKLLKD